MSEQPRYVISRMSPADVPEVAALEAGCFRNPWTEDGFREMLARTYTLYLLVRDSTTDQLLAYCGLVQSLDEADIVNVAVAKGVRGRGIGMAMLQELMKQGRARGVLRFTLEVRKSNAPALHLYEKLGFSRAGIRSNFYENPVEDAVIMWTKD